VDISWLSSQPGIVQYQQSGQSNFIVEGLDANNETTDIIVNALHDKSGTVPMNLRDSGTVRMKVTARGGWSMTIQPLSAARQFDGNADGANNDVLIYMGPAATLHVTAVAEGNFIVEAYYTTGQDILVNEIGSVDQTTAIRKGPALIVVQANGFWKFEKT
jgi:tellurite resistance protein TerA